MNIYSGNLEESFFYTYWTKCSVGYSGKNGAIFRNNFCLRIGRIYAHWNQGDPFQKNVSAAARIV